MKITIKREQRQMDLSLSSVSNLRGAKTKFLSLLAVMLLLFSSCNSDEDYVDIAMAVKITPDTNISWKTGDKIGVFMLKENTPLASANIAQGADNVSYQYTSDNTFSPADKPIYYPTSGKLDFVAYYPHTTPITDYKLAVDVSNQSDPSKIDVLYSNNAKGKSKTSGAVDLKFKHALSKLNFTLVSGTGNPNLTGATVKISGLSTKATLNLADGTITTTNNGQVLTANTAATGLASAAIVPPQTTGATSKLTVTLADNISKFDWDFSNETFEQDKNHSYTITVSKTGITISAGNITNWDTTEPEIPGDTAIRYKVGDYYPDPDVVYESGNATSGRAATGIVYWLDSPVNGKSKKGKIVSLDETSKTWADAKDWCAAKGTSWYLPAKDELKALYAGYSGKRYEDITDWGDSATMPNNSDQACQDARTAFNGKLTAAASGAEFTSAWYWSSSENGFSAAWVVHFSDGDTYANGKHGVSRVRAVSAF